MDVGYGGLRSGADGVAFEQPYTRNVGRATIGFEVVQQRRERDFPFADDGVIDHAGAKAFLGVSGRVGAAEDDLEARMGSFETAGFLNGCGELAGHAADADDADVVIVDELVDVGGGDAVDDHVEDVDFAPYLPEPASQVNVIQRDVLDVTVERRRGTDEGKHLTAIVADLTGVLWDDENRVRYGGCC